MKIKRYISAAAALAALCAAGCDGSRSYDVYAGGAIPYIAFNDEAVMSSECRINIGSEVSVSGQGAWFDGTDICISEGGVYTLSGVYDSGCINISTDDPVKLVLNNIYISNSDGYAINSSANKLVIEPVYGSTSLLSGNGGDFSVAVYSDGDIVFTGKGGMTVDGSVFSKTAINFSRSVNTFCGIITTSDGKIIPGSLYVNQ